MTVRLKSNVFLSAIALSLGLCAVTAVAGVVSGNGAEITDLEPIDAPNKADLDLFLAKLSRPEPTLVFIMQGAFTGTEPLIFMKTGEKCYLQEDPAHEIRAYYNRNTKILTFCKAFFDGSTPERVVTFAHELTHYFFDITNTDLGTGEEGVVQLFEYYYRQANNASDFATYKAAILRIRNLLDRYMPTLIMWSSPENEVPQYNRVRVIDSLDARVTYPVPVDFFANDYIPQHFLEYNLNRLWTAEPSFFAHELLAVPGILNPSAGTTDGNTFPPNDPVWSLRFTYIEVEAPDYHPTLTTEAPIPYRDTCSICRADVRAFRLKKNKTTHAFSTFLDSGKLSWPWIRLLSRERQDANYYEDRVMFFQ